MVVTHFASVTYISRFCSDLQYLASATWQIPCSLTTDLTDLPFFMTWSGPFWKTLTGTPLSVLLIHCLGILWNHTKIKKDLLVVPYKGMVATIKIYVTAYPTPVSLCLASYISIMIWNWQVKKCITFCQRNCNFIKCKLNNFINNSFSATENIVAVKKCSYLKKQYFFKKKFGRCLFPA